MLTFRPLQRSDLTLLQRWLSQPHIHAWWGESLDASALERKYGSRIDGIEPTHVAVMSDDARPIGWIQWYRWADYPAHAAKLGAAATDAGLDLAIGEVACLGIGLGADAIRLYIRDAIAGNLDLTGVLADPEDANVRSWRAFEKAGFRTTGTVVLPDESKARRRMYLPLPRSVP